MLYSFKPEGFGLLPSDGKNTLKRSVKCSDGAGVSATEVMIETATGVLQKLNAELSELKERQKGVKY